MLKSHITLVMWDFLIIFALKKQVDLNNIGDLGNEDIGCIGV